MAPFHHAAAGLGSRFDRTRCSAAIVRVRRTVGPEIARDQSGGRDGDADAGRHEQEEGQPHPRQAVEKVGGGHLRCACARADASVSTREVAQRSSAKPIINTP
jgi:hypothetical protein